jgi:thioredoxin 2
MSSLALDSRGVILDCPACGKKNRLTFDHLDTAARCAHCKHDIGSPGSPIDVASTEEFDGLVAHASVPIVVDFWAPWCGPCRMVAPELAKVAARNAGHLLVVKVNTDVLTDLGQRMAIRSIPTMAVFSGGREVERTTGARPAAEIEAFVKQAVG